VSKAKSIAQFAGSFLALPYRLWHALWSSALGPERGFIAASETVARFSGPLGIYIRQSFYKSVLARTGVDIHFGFMSLFSKSQATLGDRVYIGRFCTIGWADIGDDVMLADGVQILSGRHQHGSAPGIAGETLRDNEQSFSKVTIGKGAWLGAGAIVMADVGEGAIVGAGAVVVKPVAAGARVGGVPAKPVGA
jgi:acetyltransferase-like isoleucine patch superfamily enzyme